MKAINTHAAVESKSSLNLHPCFNLEARHSSSRIHLPVALRCNMQCNYCNRKYSCVNESRPGVTSSVLTPGKAIEYLRLSVNRVKNLRVVGIAGPGDPMACASETLETLRMVKAEFPDLMLCIASNGLNLAPYVDELASVGLSHVTVTVNAVDPKIGAKFYEWMIVDGRRYPGFSVAAELWNRQKIAIQKLAAAGVIVKVNSIFTPGINDAHMEDIAKTVSVLGASILNIMPLLPTAETAFASIPEPDRKMLQQVRALAGQYLPQMTHCARCRADAAGFIGEENALQTSEILKIVNQPSSLPSMSSSVLDPATGLPMTLSPRLQLMTTEERPFIAVASKDGLFVNQHLGEASELRIYRPKERRSTLIDLRSIRNDKSGTMRWLSIVEKLRDCAAVLVSGAGAMPRKFFAHQGITVGIVEGLIDEALEATARGGDLAFMAKAGFHCGTDSCGGEQTGCE
jgi:nitrogen fixation protein NifB